MRSASLHQRAPLLWLVLPYAAGIAASQVGRPPDSWLAGGAAAAAMAGLTAALLGAQERRMVRMAATLALVTGAAVAGFVHTHLRTHPFNPRGDPPPREVEVHLQVHRLFAARPGARSTAGVGRIDSAPSTRPELAGQLVYFTIFRRGSVAEPEAGGVYVVRGVVTPLAAAGPQPGFVDFLRNLGVGARLGRAHLRSCLQPPGWLATAARRARARLSHYLGLGLEHRPELASVIRALLLGETAALERPQQDAFMRSGTFHIFSVSGLHVGVVAVVLRGLLLLARAPRSLQFLVGVPVLWFYILIAGTNAPAIRAFIMVAFVLARGLLRLPGSPLAALVAAAGVTLVLDPRELFSSGFQLSYLVVLGLVLMGAPLGERWVARWQPYGALPTVDWGWWHHGVLWSGQALLRSLAATLSALVTSTPATIAVFGLFTPASVLANLVIVPLSSAAITAGFLSLLAGAAGASLITPVFNHAAALLILVMDWLVVRGTALPLAWFTAEFRAAWMAPVASLLPLTLILAGAAGRWRRAGGYWLPFAGVALTLLACVRLGRP